MPTRPRTVSEVRCDWSGPATRCVRFRLGRRRILHACLKTRQGASNARPRAAGHVVARVGDSVGTPVPGMNEHRDDGVASVDHQGRILCASHFCGCGASECRSSGAAGRPRRRSRDRCRPAAECRVGEDDAVRNTEAPVHEVAVGRNHPHRQARHGPEPLDVRGECVSASGRASSASEPIRRRRRFATDEIPRSGSSLRLRRQLCQP